MAAISIAFCRGTRGVRFALLTETEETVTATKKYFYTIAGEIEKLLQNGDEPQLEKLLPEVLKYFPNLSALIVLWFILYMIVWLVPNSLLRE